MITGWVNIKNLINEIIMKLKAKKKQKQFLGLWLVINSKVQFTKWQMKGHNKLIIGLALEDSDKGEYVIV